MSKYNLPITTFNGGIISKLSEGRIDVGRTKFATEIQDNFTPRTVGPMSLRPGMQYLDNTRNNEKTYPIPFVFSHDDTALIELSGSAMRVRVNDVVVSRQAVTATISDPGFLTGTNWTFTNTGGATSSIGGGLLSLSSLPYGSYSSAQQAVTINEIGAEHALRIIVTKGPIGFRIGTAGSLDDVFTATRLGTGTHSISFTPTTGTVYIRFESSINNVIEASLCTIDSAGIMELPIPYSATDLPNLSWAQSGDVIYVACKNHQQRKIERRAGNSWSIVLYEPVDGPFMVGAPINGLMTASATDGEVTLTSSQPYFTDKLNGSLLRMFTNTQDITDYLGAEDTFSDAIRVTGVGGARTFSLTISGTWTGTITLQQSSDSAVSGFTDVPSGTYTSNTSGRANDAFDNSIIWYRAGFKTGQYGSGTAVVELSFPSGGHAGYLRINTVTSPTTAQASVLADLSSPIGTRDWEEGMWSNKNGWPSAVALFQGRLWWFGQDRIWGSVSDAYESFDQEVLGDAGPISRSIGYGPVETINWGLPLQRLIIGLQSSEAEIKASNFDTPLTPTNFTITDSSTQGSATGVAAVKVDTRGIFVQQSKRRVYQLAFKAAELYDYQTTDLTALLPDIDSDLIQLVVQRQPDTRVHCLRADGTVMTLTYEPTEEVLCWYTTSTLGTIERMAVLPGDVEDQVYFYTNRTFDGQTMRFVEKFALDSECQGGDLNKQADAFIIHTQASSEFVHNLPSWMNNQRVIVWANGKDMGTYLAQGLPGNPTTLDGALPEAVTSAVIGFSYQGKFKSAKLAYGAKIGTALIQKKRINHIGLILHNTHAQGLEFGPTFDRMDNLPKTYKGATVDPDAIFGDYETPMVTLPGMWDTDSRLCLRATAPRPVTLLGAVIGYGVHDTSPSPE